MNCRYSEYIELVYSQNTFDIRDPDVLSFLPHLIVPQRVNAIRSLRFCWQLPRRASMLPASLATSNEKKNEKLNKKSNVYRDAWLKIWRNLS